MSWYELNFMNWNAQAEKKNSWTLVNFTSQICTNLNISFHNKTIEEVTTIKFLDLHINNNLKWEEHIEYAIPKLSWVCWAMRMMHIILDIRCLKISLFCLLLFSYVIHHYLVEKFNIQQKNITSPQENY
jgi:hypothetical protein